MNKVRILEGVVIIGVVVAIVEYIGLATPLWHSISWYSQHWLPLALFILGFFIALPIWWIYHIFFHVVPKLIRTHKYVDYYLDSQRDAIKRFKEENDYSNRK